MLLASGCWSMNSILGLRKDMKQANRTTVTALCSLLHVGFKMEARQRLVIWCKLLAT